MNIHKFEFGYFQENTYIIWDETLECIIIDPGNTNTSEDLELFNFIEKMKLKPVRLLLTHGHIDHIAGNDAIYSKYQLIPEVHKDDLFLIQAHEITAKMYGIPCIPSPLPKKFLNEGDVIKFGNSELYCLHTPGHSPGSISYYCPMENFVISGDVLFFESIGRTDLPKGDFETLRQSILKKLYTLPPATKVYSGHGPATTIAHEVKYNMFVRL